MGSIVYPPGSLDAREFGYCEFHSLHHTLGTAAAARLEEAAFCCCLQNFESAVSIFNAFPVESRHHPVVAYYHSRFIGCNGWISSVQTYFRKHWLQRTNSYHNSKILVSNTLLRIRRGMVHYYAESHLALVRDAMRETRSWLIHVPTQEYSDVQVPSI